MTNRLWFMATLLAAALVPSACSDDGRPARPNNAGAGAGGKGGKSGSNGAAGAAETEGGTAGTDNAGGTTPDEAGSGGSGAQGGSTGGSAGSLGQAGDQGEPIPPVGDAPVCVRDASWIDHALLAISGPGDDLLQAMTHSGTTIAWKNGATFYIADLDLDHVLETGERGLPFGAPKPVAGSANYAAVALSPDGLELIALRNDLTVVELTRNAGEAFDDAGASGDSFSDLNATLSTIPAANQVLTDPVMSADGTSFFFSHFSSSHSGSYATVHESRQSGGQWQYGSDDLGAVLLAEDDARRIPTGVSGDLLTLFYRDEVSGDFRATWRVNPTVPFTDTEVMAFGAGTLAAAPNGACTTVHYSAQGDNDVDLFVTYRED